MLEELAGPGDERAVRCIDILAKTFQCSYDVNAEPAQFAGMPNEAYYDLAWGGIPSRDEFGPSGLGESRCYDHDFGNACYIGHHYHYGQFVVSAAILVKLRPAVADNELFVTWGPYNHDAHYYNHTGTEWPPPPQLWPMPPWTRQRSRKPNKTLIQVPLD